VQGKKAATVKNVGLVRLYMAKKLKGMMMNNEFFFSPGELIEI
jgi:hypothetical protein